jgi:hypothetical protein
MPRMALRVEHEPAGHSQRRVTALEFCGIPQANRTQNAPRSAGSLTENGLISLIGC